MLLSEATVTVNVGYVIYSFVPIITGLCIWILKHTVNSDVHVDTSRWDMLIEEVQTVGKKIDAHVQWHLGDKND